MKTPDQIMLSTTSNQTISIKPSKGDYLVLFLAISVVIASFSYYWQPKMRSVQADIHVHGQFLQHVDLFEKQVLTIQGKLGPSIIAIEDGKIRFMESPCTLKHCIHQGWLSHSGEIATCLPNEISVQIAGDNPQYDSINF